MKQLIEDSPLILMEAAIVEQLRRSGNLKLHQSLVNAPLIYDDKGRAALSELYQSYIDIAAEAELPFLMCTPTWRANKSRVFRSNVSHSINTDASSFMKAIRDLQGNRNLVIKIGGMMGCKNDCYLPDEGLSIADSERFHSWQVEQLADAGVDFLIAETLPNIAEATGIAKTMATTGLPYIISFVINRNGNVLDGTGLSEAIDFIDSNTSIKPLGYMVNCAYPSFLSAELQPEELFARLIGCQANASSLNHCELDNSDALSVDEVSEWGDAMLGLNREYGIKILAGCCGTGREHLRYIVDHI
jgi:S-methylmethionine-dependent homocysteine/selenocysteine methylase